MTFAQTRPASRRYFPDMPPNQAAPPQWFERAANFLIAYATLRAGDVLEADTVDEYMIYLAEGEATVHGGDATVFCSAPCLIIAPPGKSRLEATREGRALRIFTATETDLIGLAANAETYIAGAPEVAFPEAWPTPPEGFQLRHYSLANYADKPMRMFRSTKLMINIFDLEGPRDTEALSPHSHEDFEQCSFGMRGDFVHSLRYPWSKKMSQWRPDEHLEIGSPSLLVIPATVVHTSRSVSEGRNQLVDIFCPPRRDFITAGLVCNESDYPPPP